MILLLNIFFAYLGLAVAYQFLLAVASLWPTKQVSIEPRPYRFLVLVPAYKEDEVITESTLQNLRVDYPSEDYDLVVIGDQLKASTITKLEYYGASVLMVNFAVSTKAKSLIHATKLLSLKKYNAIIVLDADNVMQEQFLNEACKALDTGALAIQGQRKAANFNNAIAVYDAIAENANTAMLCKGTNKLNFSSKLSGSGMIFRKDIFTKTILKVSAIGGFDKEMERILTKEKTFIQYWQSAVVYDQKIDSSASYSKQRGRWLQAQYAFLLKHMAPSFRALLGGNWDYFHKVWQLALPPRALILVGLAVIFLLALEGAVFYIQAGALSAILINVLTYVLVTPWNWLKKFSGQLLLHLPGFLLSNIKALGFIPRARKSFIHTAHHKPTEA